MMWRFIVVLTIFIVNLSFAIATDSQNKVIDSQTELEKEVKEIEKITKKQIITSDGKIILLKNIPVLKKSKSPKEVEIFLQNGKIIYIILK